MSNSCLKHLDLGTGGAARRIAVRVFARPNRAGGPGLFWLGGFKSDMRGTKAEALAAFAQQHGRACVRFDYSGHGESDGAFADGTIGRWLEDSLAVFDAFCRGPQILIGSSMGGWLALLLVRALRARAGSPRPACGERSAAKRPGEGGSPSTELAERAPHPNPLPASGARESTSPLPSVGEVDARSAAGEGVSPSTELVERGPHPNPLLEREREPTASVAGLVLIAPAVDFTEVLMWQQFPPKVRRTIERDGAWARPSEYSPEPYLITRRLIEEGREHLLLGSMIETGCPVRILQGVKDADVPWRHAVELTSRLAQDDVVLTLVKDGDHRLSRPEDLERLIRAVKEL